MRGESCREEKSEVERGRKEEIKKRGGEERKTEGRGGR